MFPQNLHTVQQLPQMLWHSLTDYFNWACTLLSLPDGHSLDSSETTSSSQRNSLSNILETFSLKHKRRTLFLIQYDFAEYEYFCLKSKTTEFKCALGYLKLIW